MTGMYRVADGDFCDVGVLIKMVQLPQDHISMLIIWMERNSYISMFSLKNCEFSLYSGERNIHVRRMEQHR